MKKKRNFLFNLITALCGHLKNKDVKEQQTLLTLEEKEKILLDIDPWDENK